MLSNRLAFAALALACIGAAAGGGYLAMRQTAVPVPASAQAQTVAAATAGAAAPVQNHPAKPAESTTPVQETESVVARPAPRPAPVAAPKTSAAKQVEPRAAAVAPRESRPAPAAAARQAPVTAIASADASTQPPSASVLDSAPAAPRVEERAAQEPPHAVEPPAHTFDELVVSADSVLGLQTENRVSSESARVEDRIEARVTRDVRVGGRVAIPAGSRALGSVVLVERGGKLKERARLGVRFHTLVLADGARIPIATDPIYRDGEAPGSSSSQKIGGAAVGGAILGAILGGSKGMAIGAAAGAGAGTAAVVAGDRSAATLAAGSPLTVRILQPITVTTDSK